MPATAPVASTASTPSLSATPTASPSPTPSTPAPRLRPTRSRTAPAPSKPKAEPPAPTYLAMHAATAGGRLTLQAGGAAQEFTVTLRNGNTRAYRHLLIAFQMEIMPGGSGGPGYALERWDGAAGTWRSATLRLANDAYPYAMHTGGTPLSRDEASTRRYRLRALTGAAPGPNPVMISLIDTDADTRASYVSLPQTTLGR
ncbi:hypothetical protein ACGFMM_28705 [Streptomyces sp. NPDC048604]|uniref:hypothetical protein n=1 Tax=Streptomyces sp. NPDC048604 TaxID=3365578 RepID=UPI0037212C04